MLMCACKHNTSEQKREVKWEFNPVFSLIFSSQFSPPLFCSIHHTSSTGQKILDANFSNDEFLRTSDFDHQRRFPRLPSFRPPGGPDASARSSLTWCLFRLYFVGDLSKWRHLSWRSRYFITLQVISWRSNGVEFELLIWILSWKFWRVNRLYYGFKRLVNVEKFEPNSLKTCSV